MRTVITYAEATKRATLCHLAGVIEVVEHGRHLVLRAAR